MGKLIDALCFIAIGYGLCLVLRGVPKPRPVPARECWGLERWTIDGDSAILLKFHRLPDTVGAQTKARK